ncbi:MAG: radical SAM protein [Candidatus Cloacimonetes bacterium]|nr:radical SAM protein [Candidatus Cloacimonadota bacterium]
MKIEYIEAKSILVRNTNPKNWFDIHFNINGYRGCQHDCIYCDSRSDCYHINEFSDLIIKSNAAELLEKELLTKRKKVTIGTGSMSDPYIPAEKHIRLTEKILQTVIKYKYPFHITTKSDLILRDKELLREINKTFLTVCFTITTCNDVLASKIEPKAPSPSRRLRAIQILSENGIYTGVLFQPILPFLLDSEDNIRETVYQVAQSGGKFIIPWFGVTLRKGQKEYFLDKIGSIFPEIQEKYIRSFKNQYICNSDKSKELYKFFENLCKENNIIYKMQDVQNFQTRYPCRQMTIFDFMESKI